MEEQLLTKEMLYQLDREILQQVAGAQRDLGKGIALVADVETDSNIMPALQDAMYHLNHIATYVSRVILDESITP